MEEIISYLTIIGAIIGIGGTLLKVGKLLARIEDLEKEMDENKPHIDEIPIILTLLKAIQKSVDKTDMGVLSQKVENNESRSKNNSEHIAKIFDKIEDVNKTISDVSGEVKQILGILSSRGQDVNGLR